MNKPVLYAIQQSLRFKDGVTISEIAKLTNLPSLKVLETINKNGKYVVRNRKTGKIIGLTHRSELYEKLYEKGCFWKEREANYGADCCLDFEGHEELQKELMEKTVYGGLGDSWPVERVEATDENKQRLRNIGMIPENELILDDSLWEEQK